MRWTISQLQKIRNKELIIDEYVHLDEVKEVDPTIREVSPLHVVGRAIIESTKVTFHLHITGHLILPCSRTLVDVKYPIDVKTIETFVLNSYEYEEDGEVHEVKGEGINLLPILQEIVLLEVPIQVFSDDLNQVGGAPQSGTDWEVIQEKDQVKKVDPRLAKLANFFANDSSESKE